MTDFEPTSAAVLADPHPSSRWLLEHCPVHRQGDGRYYTISRHGDVAEASWNTKLFTADTGQAPVDRPAGGLFNNPPEHTMFRRMVMSWFSVRRMDAQAPMVEALTHQLVDAMEAAGTRRAELHDDLACPLPVITIARIMGVAEDDRDRFKYWSDMQVLAMGRSDNSNRETQVAMHAYLLENIARRRDLSASGDPLPDDLISGLVIAATEAPRAISDIEMLGLLGQLLVGGNETTTSLITNCVWRLLERPELWAAVVADPALVDVAIEESLRFDPPVLGLWRKTVCPVTMQDVEIPEGARVQMYYAAANRDGDVFDDPDTFRLDRDLTHLRSAHLAFGRGVHLCLGAPLARSEARIAVRILAARLPTLRLDGPTERIDPFFLWGRKTLPVAW